MEGYYRPTKTNANWFDGFTEMLDEGVPGEEVLDRIAELACGISKHGPADTCQAYARHIRTHIEAAYRLGKAEREGGSKE